MSHFIVSFRIKSDDNYQERYSSFVKAVYSVGGGQLSVYDETSAFFAFKADGTASSICSNLFVNSKFDSAIDHMLVIDLDKREKDTKGIVKYPTILENCLGF